MGKRSEFVRRERDRYFTPIEATIPLFSHLSERTSFIEPCAGDGTLINHLTSRGHICVYASDIEPQNDNIKQEDALSLDLKINPNEIIITNPPWDRKLLHPMIIAFSDIAPTWLLFDADWVHTKQAGTYLPRLRKIVSVGRVKWIPDSTMTGKDNCAWHLFDKPSTEPTLFYGR